MLRSYLKKRFFFFSLMITDFIEEGIEQMLEVSCTVLISVTNINCIVHIKIIYFTQLEITWVLLIICVSLVAFADCEKRQLASSCLSVCPSIRNTSVSTEWIFMKFVISVFFDNLLRKFMCYENLTGITGTSFGDQLTLLIISLSFLLRRRNILDHSCRENKNTCLSSITFFE